MPAPELFCQFLIEFHKQISEKTTKFENLNKQYSEVVARNKELEYCRQQFKEYIRQKQHQVQQKNKNDYIE